MPFGDLSRIPDNLAFRYDSIAIVRMQFGYASNVYRLDGMVTWDLVDHVGGGRIRARDPFQGFSGETMALAQRTIQEISSWLCAILRPGIICQEFQITVESGTPNGLCRYVVTAMVPANPSPGQGQEDRTIATGQSYLDLSAFASVLEDLEGSILDDLILSTTTPTGAADEYEGP